MAEGATSVKYTERNGVIISSWKKHLALPWMQPVSHEDYLRAASGDELMTLTGLRKMLFSWYADADNGSGMPGASNREALGGLTS